MSVDNFIPTIWSGQLEQGMRKQLVFANLCNKRYEGTIEKAGDTVKIVGLGNITVSNYTGTVSYTELQDASTQLLIDQKKYWAFPVDDVDATQSNVNIMAAAMEQAGYDMADAVDQNIIAAILAQMATHTTNYVSTVAITSLNALEKILGLGELLSEGNVPRTGRWLVVPPFITTKLVLAKVLLENSSNDAFDNGFVGKVGGFSVYESNNVGGYMVAGTQSGMTFAGQLTKTEAMRAEGSFADYVRGLYVFGRKVVQPDALAVQVCTEGAEA